MDASHDMLSRDPYGEGLAEWLWDELTAIPAGGGIFEDHPGDCGIGLIRTEEGARLYRVHEGRIWTGPLVEWRNRESFLAYWSAQSDFGLSGADPEHPEVIAERAADVNHQRINRRRIYRFLEERQRMKSGRGTGRPRWVARITFSGFIRGEWKPAARPHLIARS